MNRSTTMIFIAMLGNSLWAQDANPISSNLKQSRENINGLVTKMAGKMPEENYRFKPTPEVQDFGPRMAHVVSFNKRTCSQLRGEQKPLAFSAAPTKAEIVAAMKQTSEEYDALFNSLTDADLLKTINAGRRGQRLKPALIDGPRLEHCQEMYGYMAVYVRLKGIVPPSSGRNER